jgi:hypothetical protein
LRLAGFDEATVAPGDRVLVAHPDHPLTIGPAR